VEGKNIIIEWRYAEGRSELYAPLAAELVSLKVDVIVTSGTPAALAAKKATKTIPIVFASVGNPVGSGIVDSLAQPGANVTGLSSFTGDLSTNNSPSGCNSCSRNELQSPLLLL
jgi:putative ABC transport system substrate-binding protein